MRSRSYQNIIEFWQVTEVSDEYGGYKVSEEKIAKSWCNIKTASNSRSSQRLTDLGVTDINSAIIIQLRHRNDIIYNASNQFIKYNGSKYIIQNVVNVDLSDVDIEIIAIKEPSKNIPVIDPINV